MILLKGGQGYTIDDSIEVIGAQNSLEGVAAEYDYLSQRFGKRNEDWTLVSQALVMQDERFFDKLSLSLKNNESVDIFFDITGFFLP